MEQFGIYSPVFGLREDIPHIFLQKTMTPDSLNCQYWNGKVRSTLGRTPEVVNASGTAVGLPDGRPVIKYLNHQSDNGSKYLLSFTDSHIYRWSTGDEDWLPMHTCSETITTWSVAQLNGEVVATNNSVTDEPLFWDGTTTNAFVKLNATVATSPSTIHISRAKSVINYENHIVFGNYQLSQALDGVSDYPNGLIMSDLDDLTQWLLGAAGDQSAYYSEGIGTIIGLGRKRDLLYCFKTRSTRVWWYTGTDAIMHSRPHSETVGTASIDSIGNDGDGNLYFFGSDFSFREVEDGIISQPVRETARKINTEDPTIQGIRFAYIPEYNEIWWAVPVTEADPQITNNKILCYQLNGIWYMKDMPISAFGSYDPSDTISYTWDNQPEGAWDDWEGIWDDTKESAGWSLDICGDFLGYTYRTHGSVSDASWQVDTTGETAVDTVVSSVYSVNPDNAAAVDKGGGLVGIPITGHSFVADEYIIISGTTNYDGKEQIVSQTTDEIVITATFVSETFAGTEVITNGHFKFTVAAGTATNDLYNDYVISLTSDATGLTERKLILDWTAGRVVTVNTDFTTIPAVNDEVRIEKYSMQGTSPQFHFTLTTDMGDKRSLRFFKRLLYMYGYFRSIKSGVATVYIKEDSSFSWKEAGTIVTDGSQEFFIGEIPLDYRARSFLIKIESSEPFEFLGAEFEYLSSGLR